MPPLTLTKAQFAKTQAAKHGGTWDQYLHYLAVHRAKHGLGHDGTSPSDPLTPTDPATLQAQASAAVHAQVDPLLTQIQNQFARKTTAGTSAITSGTKTLMDAFAQYAPAEKAAYGQAVDQTSALNTQLANRLTGQGTALQGDLAAKLAQINAPGATQDKVAVGTGAIGAGAANAGFAQGAANISDLISRGAAARDYGAKLPGIAALTGATNLRNLAAQTESERATALGDIRAKIPGLISDQLTNARTNEFNKAVAKLGLVQNQMQTTARTQADAASAARPDPSLSNTVGYVVDANGNPILDQNGNTIPTQSSQAKAAAAAAKPGQAAAKKKKDRQSAMVSATGSVVPLFTDGATIATTNPATGEKTNVRVKIGSPAYNRIIHQAAAAVSDALGPYLTPQQILAWVQQKARPFFAPPKQGKPNADPAVNPKAAGPPLPPGFTP